MAIRTARSLIIAVFAITVMLSFSAFVVAQYTETNTEKLVVCPAVIPPQVLTPFEFAKSNLVSLWYGRNAAERADEIQKAEKEIDNWFSFSTAMMRITKEATNDFICAKRSMLPFAGAQSGENITTVAQLLQPSTMHTWTSTNAGLKLSKKWTPSAKPNWPTSYPLSRLNAANGGGPRLPDHDGVNASGRPKAH